MRNPNAVGFSIKIIDENIIFKLIGLLNSLSNAVVH